MKISSRIFSIYDGIVSKVTWAMISYDRVEKTVDADRKHSRLESAIEYYWHTAGSNFNRASTLMSHLSIMTAVSIFAFSEATSTLGRLLFGLDVALYIFLVLYTARTLKALNVEKNYSDIQSYEHELRSEVLVKHGVAQVSLALTILATFVLFVLSVFNFVI